MPIERKIIECSGCREWYHLDSMTDIPERAADELDYVWFCTSCINDETECNLDCDTACSFLSLMY